MLVADSQDRSLAQLLAALAEDVTSPAASQQAALHVVGTEDSDSVLSTQRSSDPSSQGAGVEAGEEGEEEESVVMTQRVWHDHTQLAGCVYPIIGK